MTINKLPAAEPPVFAGDPLAYPDWLHSFDTLIDSTNLPDETKLLHMKRYLKGPALEAVSGFFLLRSRDAYAEARRTLHKRYGNGHLVAESFRQRLDSWKKIGPKESKNLRSYGDFLQQCLTAKSEVHDLDILDDPRQLATLANKLPDWLCNRWRREANLYRRERGRYPKFKHLTYFVKDEAELLNDPIDGVTSAESHRQPPPSGSSSKRFDKASTFLSTTAKSTKDQTKKCLFCESVGHSVEVCRKFSSRTANEKREFVKNKNLCLACLRPNHRARDCKNRSVCQHCKEKHPSSLHATERLFPANRNQVQQDPKHVKPQEMQETQEQTSKKATVMSVKGSHTGLTSMILPVYLSSKNDPDSEILVYALLDTQSDSTFVVEDLASHLNSDATDTSLRITTITNTGMTVPCKKYTDLTVRGFNSDKVIALPTTYSRKDIPLDPGHVPLPSTAKKWPHLQRIASRIAPKQVCPAGLLIGYNCAQALSPISFIGGENDQPFAVETPLGWTVVGGTPNDNLATSVHSIINVPSITALSTKDIEVSYVLKSSAKEVGTDQLIKLLEQDFKETSDQNTCPMSFEDRKFMNILEGNVHQRKDGFYELPLPFRDGPPDTPNNRFLAEKRLLSLKSKLDKNLTYRQHYTDFMKGIIVRGEAEKVPQEELQLRGPTWYIPHHGVYNAQKPDKIRVVFDCSAKFKGFSLNESLLQGPDLMNSLTGVLMRFRKESIAFALDIEKMFHQFRVSPQHTDYLRFLWWEDGDLSKPPTEYRMTVHLFGAVSSPGCANFALKQIASDYKHISPDASRFLTHDFYVDDGLESKNSVKEAKRIISESKAICSKANLNLHKITSNSKEVVHDIDPNSRAIPSLESQDPDGTSIEKALGLQWDTDQDILSFRIGEKEHKETRRGLLATVASVFDPLGLVSPFVLLGRRILQQTCEENLGWDQQIPADIKISWQNWKQDLNNLKMLKIPRCIKPPDFGMPIKTELHHFSDASTTGYGQCSYLRLQNSEGQTHCTLVMAKARVAPKKATTIPRLELQAATLSSKIAKTLDKELDYPHLTHFYWTDSKVVLGYIKNESKRFQIFVANRIQQIRQFSNPDQWNYVHTSENPADHASRGLPVDLLNTSNWFTGPDFLWQSEIIINNPKIEIASDDSEIKHSATSHAISLSTLTSFEEKTKRFSDYQKLLAAISVIVRVTAQKKGLNLSKLEIKEKATKNLLQIIQKEHFQSTKIPEDLESFEDKEGLQRAGGRLGKSNEPFEIRHPIILPKSCHLAQLITLELHKKVAHQGRNTTMNAIRAKGYWIIGCRRTASSVIHNCTKCIRIRGKSHGQRMSDLPSERLEPSPPFTYCGIDVFGPFTTKEGRKELKKYGLIFTCLALRAIHIELLDDMSTDAFLNALRCFIALRGKVRTFYCDCGTNFTGGSNELKENLKLLDTQKISADLLDSQCEFKFNPPNASHMGGIWERQIRTVRNILSGLIANSAGRLDSSSLRTFFYESAAIVNSRPLTTDNLERSDGPLPLTPNHLLTMKSGVIIPPPPGNFVREDLYLRKRWRKVQYLTDTFWQRWKSEYIQNLRSRQKWRKEIPNLNAGDIVLVESEVPRSEWQMARVEDTFPSQDGLVRKVKLLIGSRKLDRSGKNLSERSYLIRPVHKLIPLLHV